MSPSLLGGFAWMILASLTSSVDVPLTFYTSTDCVTASTITPNLALNLSICIVTPGLVSLHYDDVPCAGGGIVIPYLFKDTSCETQQDILDYYKTGSNFRCLSDFSSTSVAAIMLSCNKNKLEEPLATSTVTVGPVATGASSSPSSTSGISSSSSSDSTAQNDNHPNDFGWNSLSSGARIGIIVAGVAVFIITFGYSGQRFMRKPAIVQREPSQFWVTREHIRFRA